MSRRATETPDYAAMMLRMVRAYARRVADADEPDLADMARVRDGLDAAILEAVAGMRARGKSWAYIAQGLGVTRQAAQQWYARSSEAAAS